MNPVDIFKAVLWFALLGGVLGLVLAFAAKIFAVKKDERVEKVRNNKKEFDLETASLADIFHTKGKKSKADKKAKADKKQK